MTRLETFLQRAYQAIEAGNQAIDAELAAAEKSVDASEDLLRKIRESLVEMRCDLEDGGGGRYYGGFGRMIIESWPMNAPLGNVLLNAELKYEDARKVIDRKPGRSGQ